MTTQKKTARRWQAIRAVTQQHLQRHSAIYGYAVATVMGGFLAIYTLPTNQAAIANRAPLHGTYSTARQQRSEGMEVQP